MMTLPRVPLVLLGALSFLVACDVRQDEPAPNEREMVDEAMRLYSEGSYQRAEDRLNEAVPLLRSRSRLRELAHVHATLARIAFVSGRFREAITQIGQSITVSREARDYRGEAARWLLKGDFLAELSDYGQAQGAYDKALSLYSAFNDRRERNRTLLRKGRAWLLEGRSEDATVAFQQALTLSLEEGKAGETAEGLSGMAQAYFLQGRFSESANTFAQARDAATDDAHGRTRSQLGLARSLRALGDQTGALAAADAAVRDAKDSADDALQILSLFERGMVAKEQTRFGESLEFLNQAIRLAQESGDQIALQYLTLFRVQLTEQSLAPSERSARFLSLVNEYAKVADAFALIDNRTGEAYARIRRAKLLRRMNRRDEARDEYRAALEVEDSRLGEYMNPERHRPYIQELGLGPVREHWYQDHATLLVQMNDPDAALAVMERARLKRQFTVLRHAPPNLQIPSVQVQVDSLNGLIGQMTTLQQEISGMLAVRPLLVLPQHVGELKKELKDLRRRAGVLSAALSSALPNYAPAVYVGAAPLLNLQPLIPQGTIVVQYLPGDEELIILALTPRRLEVRRAPVSREKLAGMLAEYVRLMQDPIVYAGAGGEASVEPMLRFAILSPELYGLLLKPLESLFGERIVLVPDGMFEGFPIHALEQQGAGGEIRYLVEIVGVQYVPSLTSLTYRTIERRPIRTVTGIGNPTGRDWSIDYELRDLRSFFKEAGIYTGLEATWSRLISESTDLLILSTDFHNPVPEVSFGTFGLSDGVTSGELSFEGFERMTELRPAPVVLLSNHGERGAGLRPDHANLLRLRGTPDVFLNAWPADRKAAKFFSEFFVTHIANGLAPTDAYRQALLNLIQMREVQHPRSWGQFFHFGGF